MKRTRFLGLLCLFLICQAQAATLRVVTWDLESGDPNPPKEVAEARLRKAAAVLQRLDPEVVLLQSVAGWPACQQLVQLLQPKEFRVLVCSSFGNTNGAGEVAVLARQAARMSWAEPWQNGAGFAFAVLPFNKKKVGIYSVRMPSSIVAAESDSLRQIREARCRELLTQIESLTKWKENRVDLLVLGGNFATSPEQDEEEQTLLWLEEAGLANAYQSVTRENRLSVRSHDGLPEVTADYFFLRNGAFVGAPSLNLAEGFLHRPVTVEIDPDRVWVQPPGLNKSAALKPKHAKRWLVPMRLRPWRHENRSYPSGRSGPVACSCFWREAFSFWWWRLSVRLRASPMWKLSGPTEKGGLLAGGSAGALPGPSAVQAADELPEPEAEDIAHWRERAEEAERRAAQATHALKQGMVPQLVEWFKQHVVRKLVSQRSELLDSHERTQDQVRALEQQVARIHGGLQDRIQMYERRIGELEQELSHANAERRELLTIQIRRTREQLERARQEVPQRN